jgi:DNA-binding FadR family transcriptional regulator
MLTQHKLGATRKRLPLPAFERTLHAQVAREIGLQIVEGRLSPGAVLPNEADFGNQLGVSRTALREAVKVLAAKGLVEVRRKTGTRVRPQHDWNALDPDVLNWLFSGKGFTVAIPDLLELRLIIEPAGAKLAAVRATPEDLAKIELALQGMETAVEDSASSVESDLKFHLAILEATHNTFMRPFGALIQEALRASFKLTNRDQAAFEKSLRRHRDVFEAIRDRNPEAAEIAMKIVLNRTSEDIERSLPAKVANKAAKKSGKRSGKSASAIGSQGKNSSK